DLRLLAQKIPGHPHPCNVFQFDRHEHPEGTDEADLRGHDQAEARVLVSGECGQDAQAGASSNRLLLRQYAGTTHPDRAGAGNLVEKQQVLTEHQIIHVTDEAMLLQITAAVDWTMLLQVSLAR